jgi:integrase/recombinase XerD
MTPLRRRLIDELTRRNYSPRTVEAYVGAVARAARHFRRPPDRLTPGDLRDYQLHLIAAAASWSRFNQAACALRFFYRHVLGRPEVVPAVPFARRPRALPVVLAPAEVRRLLAAVPPGRNRLIFRLAYGCGLRLGELTHLRVADIDPARHLLWVRRGKGGHDRGVPLPDRLLDELRAYRRDRRPPDLLFTAPGGGPLGPAVLQRAIHRARRAGQAGHLPHPPALLRHPPAGGRDRPADPPAAARPPPPVHHPRLPAPAGRPPAPDPVPVGTARRIGYDGGRWADRPRSWPTWRGGAGRPWRPATP